ncbi:RICIN domain-containing protein [Vibrio tasmaniensis]|jgi:hypothetical protein|uniref:RICIN domain-containing protein n=1 Tax=Vibrio tasmaniensis TaxID=212663 RepID=UPI00107F3129|nr:hypothetical protein [Vibrio tasmaniensis]
MLKPKQIKFISCLIGLVFTASGHASIVTDDLAGYEFNSQCLINSEGATIKIEDCQDLLVFDLASLSKESQINITKEHLGIGFEANYVYVKHALDKEFEEIYALDDYDQNYLYNSILQTKNSTQRSKRSLEPTSEEYLDGKLVRSFHRRFRTGSGTSELIYKISMYAQSPVTNGGTRRKYVDVTLNQGAGIDFNTGYTAAERWIPKNHFIFYRMPQYYDQFEADVYVDNSKLSTGEVVLTDWHPKKQEQQDLDITKSSTTEFSFGLKNIPKSPIESVGLKFTDEISIKSSKIVSLDTSVHSNHFSLMYRNDAFGENGGDANWCKLVTKAKGCWFAYANYDENPYDYSALNSAYKSGIRPDFNLTFSTTDESIGTSTIKIETNARGIGLLGHNRWAAGQLYYSGTRTDNIPYRLYDNKDTISFEVDWNHPVYLGSETVNISSIERSGEVSKCLTSDSKGGFTLENCVLDNISQAFIYSPNRQYHLASSPDLCLDSSFNQLAAIKCEDYPSRAQRWQWTGSDNFDNDILYSSDIGSTISVITPDSKYGLNIIQVEKYNTKNIQYRFDSYGMKLY